MTDNKIGFISCDPGSPLSLALISHTGALRACVTEHSVATRVKSKWTNSPELTASVIKEWQDKTSYSLVVVTEAVSARSGEGVVSATKFVGSMWLLRGIASGLGMRAVTVSPAKWKVDLKLRGGVENKDMSRAMAAQIFPDKAELFRLKKSHNLAEAALIGWWAHLNKSELGIAAVAASW